MLLQFAFVVLISKTVADLVQAQCYDQFPVQETVDIFESIISEYGQVIQDEQETWKLIAINRNQKIMVNGRQYFLNRDFHDYGSFRFRSSQFSDLPVYVVPEGLKPYPFDVKYELKSISFQCGEGEVVCGLSCCRSQVQDVQEELLTSMRRRMRRDLNALPFAGHDTIYNEDWAVTVENRNYSFYPENLLSKSSDDILCSYAVSVLDPLFTRRNGLELPSPFIYYHCSANEICCGLSCEKNTFAPRTAQSTELTSMALFSAIGSYFPPSSFHLRVFLAALIIIALCLYAYLLVKHIRRLKRRNEQPAPRNVFFTSIDKQTSCKSLLLVEIDETSTATTTATSTPTSTINGKEQWL